MWLYVKSICALVNFWLKAGPHGKGLSVLTQRISALSLILWTNSLLSNVDYSGLDLFFCWHSKLIIVCVWFFYYSPCSGFGVGLHLGLAWSLYSQSILNYLSMKSYRLEMMLSNSHHLLFLAFWKYLWSLQCFLLLRWWIILVTINIHGFLGPFYIILSAIYTDTVTPKEFLCANESFITDSIYQLMYVWLA